MIGYGIRRGKLYYLVTKDSDKLHQALLIDGSEGEKKNFEIWPWNQRLRYASFGYLKKLFPSMFIKVDISSCHVRFMKLQRVIVVHFH